MIRMVEDVGAPVLVTAIDLVTETTAPQWNEWAAYITAAAGYLSAWMGWGGPGAEPFLKNMGIASAPWAAKKLYDRVRAMGTTSPARRLAFRPASRVSSQRWPAPSNEPQFGSARLT